MLKALAQTGSDPGQVWLPSRTFFTHALTTVWTVTQTTPWYAVRSGCNQKSSIVQRNWGTRILMSAR